MKSSPFSRGALTATGWLGLAWVYSGVFWLVGLFTAAAAGWPGGVIANAVRVGMTLAVGIGICAGEAWTWAAAVCLGALYAAVSLALSMALAAALLTLPPGHLSWMPVLLGMNAGRCTEVAWLSGAVTIIAGMTFRLLWREQAQFGVPYRRAFTVLLQAGSAPALLVVLTDMYLLYAWWSIAVS